MVRPVLLTGATGHVGGWLLDRLLAEERPVRAVSWRPERLPERAGLQPVRADVSDREAVGAVADPSALHDFDVRPLGLREALGAAIAEV